MQRVLGSQVLDFYVVPITGDLESTVPQYQEAPGKLNEKEMVISISCEKECCEIPDEIRKELLERHEDTVRKYEF